MLDHLRSNWKSYAAAAVAALLAANGVLHFLPAEWEVWANWLAGVLGTGVAAVGARGGYLALRGPKKSE